jgi:hypothetical protein
MRKTALQESIIFWENQYRLWVELGSVGNDGNLMDYFIRHLKSKLPQEKQDLIDAFDEGTIATSYNTFDEEYEICPSKEEYFNQTFETDI